MLDHLQLALGGPDAEQEIARHRADLSSLVDRGRLLFPNEREAEIGIHKPGAYRGLRHRSLDPLIAAYRLLSDDHALDSSPDKQMVLFEIRRVFVSRLQAIIRPREVNRKIAQLTRSSCSRKDATSGGLLPDKDSEPAGAEALLNEILLRCQNERPYED